MNKASLAEIRTFVTEVKQDRNSLDVAKITSLLSRKVLLSSFSVRFSTKKSVPKLGDEKSTWEDVDRFYEFW